MRPLCPKCTTEVVKPSGYASSKILVIGESPGLDELKSGKPFVGGAGKILRSEMANAGLDLFRCRLINLWLHTPPKKTADNFEECFDAGMKVCLEEAKGKEAILLLGADTVQFFTGLSVSDVTGLQVDSNQLSAPIIYACVNPAIVFHKNVGEVRFAINNFVSALTMEGVI